MYNPSQLLGNSMQIVVRELRNWYTEYLERIKQNNKII